MLNEDFKIILSNCGKCRHVLFNKKEGFYCPFGKEVFDYNYCTLFEYPLLSKIKYCKLFWSKQKRKTMKELNKMLKSLEEIEKK